MAQVKETVFMTTPLETAESSESNTRKFYVIEYKEQVSIVA